VNSFAIPEVFAVLPFVNRSFTYMNHPVSQFKAENRFPDCILMKLHSTPAQAEESTNPFPPSPLSVSNPSRPDLVDLKVTIRFGQEEIKIKRLEQFGRAWFSLRRGELKLTLKTGKIPLEKMGLTASFQIEYELEEQREEGMESGSTIGVSSSIATKGISRESSKVKSKVSQVRTIGTEKAPGWVFESKIDKLGLTGQLTEVHLGMVETEASPCDFEAIFTVRGQQDIVLTEGSLLLAKDIVRNKSALLEREFFLRYIAQKLQPYLSRIEGAL